MRFTFLVHPLSEWMLRLYSVRNLQGEVLATRFGQVDRFAFRADLIKPITVFPRIASDLGPTCAGRVVGIPTLPEQMLADQAATVALMRAAVERWAHQSELVGLGALCAIVGLRGEELAQQVKLPVTTGNALTCWTSVETTAKLYERLSRGPRFRRRVLMVGMPGTIANPLAAVLAERGLPVEVYHPSWPKPLSKFVDQLEAKTGRAIPRWTDLQAAVQDKGILVGASSLGGELAQVDLRPGTAVVDVAQPLDTTPAQRRREDLLIVEGEMLGLPKATDGRWQRFTSKVYNMVVGQDDRHVLACLAEPMVLCLEERAESFSLGRNLDPARVHEIGALARRHGFEVRDFLHDGRALDPEDLDRFARIPWLP